MVWDWARFGAGLQDAGRALAGRPSNVLDQYEQTLEAKRRRERLAAAYQSVMNILTPQQQTIASPTSNANPAPMRGQVQQPASLDAIIPAIAGYGKEGGDIGPLLEMAKMSRPATEDPVKLGPGDILTRGGRTIASNPIAQTKKGLTSVAPGSTLYDQDERAPIFTAPPAPQAPDKGTQANQDAIAMGLKPGTKPYNDYIMARTVQKPSQTTVNLPPQQSAFQTEVGRAQGKRYSDIIAAADSARGKIDMLGALGPALADAPFAGPLAETFTNATMLAKQLGISDTDTAGAEAARSLSNQMTMMLRNPAGGAGMPGAMSDADRNFLKQAVPGLANSRGGAKKMIELAMKLEQRKIEVADLASKYAELHGNLGSGFDAVLKRYAESHPLFNQPNRVGRFTIETVEP